MGNAIHKSSYGTVKPYTRHTQNCIHRDKAGHNGCNCPKWLYENQKGKAPLRRSLSTPSWAEAQRIASQTLRGFDPEIAAARLTQVKRDNDRMSVADACKLWMVRTERECGVGGTFSQYQYLMKKLERWANANDIHWSQDVTTLQLERWYSSPDWTGLMDATRSQRWGVLRSMFAYLKERQVIKDDPISPIKKIRTNGELVQGPYTDEQVKKIFAQVENGPIPPTTDPEEKKVYRQRMIAFLILLLHTGCDLVDAVLFEPDKIEDLTVDGNVVVPVFRYRRTKTGVLAVIPLTQDVATMLRNVPTLPSNPPGMPFRTIGTRLILGPICWSRRINRYLRDAQVTTVALPGKDNRGRPRTNPANAKQFRHTFAVQQLRAGQRPEEVAKMLGHSSTKMIREHYAPWVEELDTAHVRMVTLRRTANLPNRGLTVVSAQSTSDAPAGPRSLVSAS